MKKLLITTFFAAILIIATAQKKHSDKPVFVDVISCESGKTVMVGVKKCDVHALLVILNFEGKYKIVPARKKTRTAAMLDGFSFGFIGVFDRQVIPIT